MPVFRSGYKALVAGAVLCIAPFHPVLAQAPQRVMSLNICTDQLLRALAPERRIASVTFMSREPQPLRYWPVAARVPVNHGSAEEVLAAKPDLVLTGPFLSPLTRSLLEKSGAKIVAVPLAENFDQIRAVTRQVAFALHAEARGEVLVAQMDEDLRALAKNRPAKTIRVAQWGNGGYVPGQSGLFGAMLKVMGAQSITLDDGFYEVEGLLAGKPDALIFADTYAGLPTLRAEQDGHPALRQKYPRLTYSFFYGCGVPQLAAAALKLQGELKQAVRK
jgi:iron complex transport system substrate-binding protein